METYCTCCDNSPALTSHYDIIIILFSIFFCCIWHTRVGPMCSNNVLKFLGLIVSLMTNLRHVQMSFWWVFRLFVQPCLRVDTTNRNVMIHRLGRRWQLPPRPMWLLWPPPSLGRSHRSQAGVVDTVWEGGHGVMSESTHSPLPKKLGSSRLTSAPPRQVTTLLYCSE